MNWRKMVAGVGLVGCLLMTWGCVKAVTGQYYNLRADQLYDDNQKRQAFELYYQSAQTGSAESQYMLAQMLLFGDGIHANTIEGMHWLEKAAQQDHAAAARDLGVYLLSGEFGRPQDPQRGVWFLERAAAGNDTFAMLTLGYLHLTGYGVVRNPQTAAYWYGQAALNGEPVPEAWQDGQFLAALQTPPPFDAGAESRARVKRAQAGLKALGYYNSGIDGIAGPGTIAAVKRFQKDRQLEADGRIDVALMRSLYRHIVFEPLQGRM